MGYRRGDPLSISTRRRGLCPNADVTEQVPPMPMQARTCRRARRHGGPRAVSRRAALCRGRMFEKHEK